MVKHLKERKRIGKDEFPKTLTLAINTLSTQQYNKDKNNNFSMDSSNKKQHSANDN